MDHKSAIAAAVNSPRFRIDDCIDFEASLAPAQAQEYAIIKRKLTPKEFKAFRRSIIRNSFLIEPVNDDVTSTKVEAHWSPRLKGDVRYASYESCVDIFHKLLHKIANLSADDFNMLKEFFNYTVVPYEMPVDYIDRFASPIHSAENVDLYLTDEIKACITMRRFIRDTRRNPASAVFQAILADKIKVKTYLTDRAQTGDHKTNREKRWEAHPNSVQYALRRSCMKIETKLLLQIATFDGCDTGLVHSLQSDGLLPSTSYNNNYGLRRGSQPRLFPSQSRSC